MKSVVVFCGSRKGERPEYLAAARELGQTLAERELTLVYGGGRVGLMGAVAEAALDAGGKVIGVIPAFMRERELALAQCTELIVVDSMHTRKARMAELGDAFIAMAGGFGTFDELFEILTWGQIGIHGKPVGLLNTAGYYSALYQFLGQTVTEGFVHDGELAKLQMANTPAALVEQLAATPLLPARWQKADLFSKT
ncbi:LOG family protein [Silvimonas iriomotensis]|uniref:Cytokinin riboside 5'-monophosphate phosphoribohydrolase n=1 Tax=Silvimonas iriomotensis TaxID=449662 RepID=A0ABQ2P7E4_9NEIS|nr:TIGR00730 family Rossman fold protein [Silvimonas iriomotensis]GGP20198.1 putative cytokinin riboside 5'-monophosphate phosphoribohydrolase [Silvimonas iriomotensis]